MNSHLNLTKKEVYWIGVFELSTIKKIVHLLMMKTDFILYKENSNNPIVISMGESNSNV
ncbi:MAG: hypothetical protein P8I02_06345 [Flavobacteriales bacterium]|nr:hypothetical protein [Flavobacteriales bacterium]